LSFVKDLKYAFGDDQKGKEKALGNFSFEDLTEVFRKGTGEQQEALKEAIKNSSKTDKMELFTNAKSELSGSAPTDKSMRKNLGLQFADEE